MKKYKSLCNLHNDLFCVKIFLKNLHKKYLHFQITLCIITIYLIQKNKPKQVNLLNYYKISEKEGNNYEEKKYD